MTVVLAVLILAAVLVVLVGAVAFSWVLVRFGRTLPGRADEILNRIDIVRSVDELRDELRGGVGELRGNVSELREDVDELAGQTRDDLAWNTTLETHLTNLAYELEEQGKEREAKFDRVLSKLAGTGLVGVLREESR